MPNTRGRTPLVAPCMPVSPYPRDIYCPPSENVTPPETASILQHLHLHLQPGRNDLESDEDAHGDEEEDEAEDSEGDSDTQRTTDHGRPGVR
ncbi:GM11623 [Drosophila sechellia]|uniref:GM11623 n=1 Tax=Drosophila sechellia TaxID=7238 RepID=B4IGR4_DROSE|nr:GM11623 [Drosophila sechellia]